MARYIVFRLVSELPARKLAGVHVGAGTEPACTVSVYEVKTAFNRIVTSGIGCIGVGTSGYHFLADEYDPKRGVGIVKTTSSGLIPVRAALAIATWDPELGHFRIDVLGVSGTIKKAKEKFI